MLADGEVKILDVGLALWHAAPEGQAGLTSAGQGMGTPNYMAPEQRQNARAVGTRALSARAPTSIRWA